MGNRIIDCSKPMGKLQKCFILGFFDVLIFLLPLHVQADSYELLPPKSSASFTATNPAPEAAIKNLSELVHAGKSKEAQQSPNPDQQNALLKQFMDRSSPFLKKRPNELLLWKIRAASALSLDDPNAGYEAGQKLLAANSNDPNLQQLPAKLKLKGWLDKQTVEEQKKYGWTSVSSCDVGNDHQTMTMKMAVTGSGTTMMLGYILTKTGS